MTGTIDANTIGTPGVTDSGCFVSACDGISLPDSATANTNVYHVTATNNQINHVHGGITSNIGGISGGTPRTSFVFTGNTDPEPDRRHSGQRYCDQLRHAAGQRAADLRRDLRQHAEWRVERPQWRLDPLPPPRRRRLDVPRAQLRRRLGHRCLRDRHQHRSAPAPWTGSASSWWPPTFSPAARRRVRSDRITLHCV